ncbi:hypothetical protein [Cyclobacterium amurskyense]|uniref:hypothetical protein n=1 Tax=Cyclobacterium amurskyense TaxID=320787 RepID=UPI0030D79B02|tara:strand:+ start:5402 stop:5989 length:588 start_codon:yes stop_codon:yes gene_type:complete
MKKIKPILLTLVAFTLLSFTLSNSTIFEEDLEDIGIIKQSLLKPNQFNKTQKGTWVLLNGQEINKKSELYKLLGENFDLNILTKNGDKYFLPNASGAFIRSSNVNGEGHDPDKTRKVGSFQLHAFKKHNHPLEKNIYRWNRSFSGHSTGPHVLTNGSDGGTSNSKWVFETKHSGGSVLETRPSNISMYTYIKISN